MTSTLAERFGARIRLTDAAPPGQVALHLVITRGVEAAPLVRGIGGQAALRLPDPSVLIAALTVPQAIELRAHPAVRVCGAVALDQDRFAAACAALGPETP